MSAAAIHKALAKEFSIGKDEIGYAFESLAAGLKPAYLAHFRRAEVGNLTEGALRRLDRRRRQFEDMDARRANVLKTITGDSAADQATRRELEACTHRWQLDNLLVALRKPEPEVQLALDRGLGELADLLVRPTARAAQARAQAESGDVQDQGDQDQGDQDQGDQDQGDQDQGDQDQGDQGQGDQGQGNTGPATASGEGQTEGSGDGSAATAGAPPEAVDAVAGEEQAAQSPPDTAAGPSGDDSHVGTDEASGEVPADPRGADESATEGEQNTSSQASGAAADEGAPQAASAVNAASQGKPAKGPAAAALADDPAAHMAPAKVDFSPELARVCLPFVNPDRDLHKDEQVLEGAMRILSDRLGRDVRLRGALRRQAFKSARLSVRAIGDEKKLTRSRALLKLNAPLSQLQGHRLLGLRQAMMQRQVNLVIRIDPAQALPKVRAALGRKNDSKFDSVLDAVAERALWRRLVPFLEEEIKHELRERADEEALRFLGQSLRHVLLAPCYGDRPVAGLDVNPKGDWTVALLDASGVPLGSELKLEPSGTELGKLAEELSQPMREHGVRAIAVGNGKGAREAVRKLREIISMLGADAMVFPVNEAGLSSYANSEFARKELGELSVPARMAVSLGRRLQDPLQELLKVDARHLGLGREQSLVSKANLRRLTHDTVESSVAFVGCDLNQAPLHVLRHVPGLDFDIAKKIVDRRQEKPFTYREELRTDGVFDGIRWTNAAGFLILQNSSEPLERATVHPEQYEHARAICLSVGASVEEVVGNYERLRRAKRADSELPENAWRDLMRALARGGRDGRPRLHHPTLLAPDTDLATLTKDRVVEGIVSNVTSFGVFVDLGIPNDGMIHISEISIRYVRDAREMLSVGQIVRARVLDASGPRIELSLKNVPDERRERRPPRHGSRPTQTRSGGERGERGRGREGGRERKQAWPEHQPVVRAARTRRDGLAGAAQGRGEGRGGGGRGGGGGRRSGGPSRGGPRRGARRDDAGYDADAVRRSKQSSTSYNPFATFFKERTQEEEG